METKHTPGPWIAVGRWVEHVSDGVGDICNCDPSSMDQEHLGRSSEECMANARLIACALELLELVIALRDAIERELIVNPAMEDSTGVLFDGANELIAKATGGA